MLKELARPKWVVPSRSVRHRGTGQFVLGERAGEKLGRAGTAMCVDATYITQRKRIAKQGPVGRKTAGTTTCILGMYELDLGTRRGTGRVVLKTITGETRASMERNIRKHVMEGALVWTDSHQCYAWPGRGAEPGRVAPPGYRHEKAVLGWRRGWMSDPRR